MQLIISLQILIPLHRVDSLTSLESAVQPGGAVGHDRLDLEELFLAVVPANDGEAQAS